MDLPPRIGRYDVEPLRGEGGMGRVLLARDTVLGREVALKILRDDLGLTPELKAQLVDRMRQGARAAATLSHPAMVTLHDMGEDEHVGLYLVFERILGPTLRERLHAKGPRPPAEGAAARHGRGRARRPLSGLRADPRPDTARAPPRQGPPAAGGGGEARAG